MIFRAKNTNLVVYLLHDVQDHVAGAELLADCWQTPFVAGSILYENAVIGWAQRVTSQTDDDGYEPQPPSTMGHLHHVIDTLTNPRTANMCLEGESYCIFALVPKSN